MAASSEAILFKYKLLASCLLCNIWCGVKFTFAVHAHCTKRTPTLFICGIFSGDYPMSMQWTEQNNNNTKNRRCVAFTCNYLISIYLRKITETSFEWMDGWIGNGRLLIRSLESHHIGRLKNLSKNSTIAIKITFKFLNYIRSVWSQQYVQFICFWLNHTQTELKRPGRQWATKMDKIQL